MNQPLEVTTLASEIPHSNTTTELVFCFLCSKSFELGAAPKDWKDRSFRQRTSWQVFCKACIDRLHEAVS